MYAATARGSSFRGFGNSGAWGVLLYLIGAAPCRPQCCRSQQHTHTNAAQRSRSSKGAYSPLEHSAPCKRIKMSLVDQHLDAGEFDVLDVATAMRCFEIRHTSTGGDAWESERILQEADVKPTKEQLTELHAHLKQGSAWVDLATWTAQNETLTRSREFKAFVGLPGGGVQLKEFKGPPNILRLTESITVWRNAMIMLGALHTSAGDRYIKRIRDMHELYGHSCYGQLYQADFRARYTQVLRIWHQAVITRATEHKKHIEAGSAAVFTHPFNPARPWDFVFGALAEDDSFWDREYLLPAGRVLTYWQSMPNLVTGEAAFDKEIKPKGHYVNSEGTYVRNRPATPMNLTFNQGTCRETTLHRSKHGGRWVCAVDKCSVHQCSACLSPEHSAGSEPCRGSTTAKPPTPPKRGAKGRFKGKKYRPGEAPPPAVDLD